MAPETPQAGPEPGTDPDAAPACWIALGWLLVVATVGLRLEGRRWWCGLGDRLPWSTGIHSPHTSQHLFDPYSVTHVLHGFLFYAGLHLVAGRLSRRARLLVAVAIECAWELAENSAGVIARYRAGTVAIGYEGDAVANSLGDVASCILGFLLAARLPVRWSIALFLLADGLLLAAYRDNLLLNVVMLVHPIEAIRSWQAGR